MRLAKQEDLESLKEIWKLCFGDEDSFINFYFQNRDWLAETAILCCDDRIASMLTMIPTKLVAADGEQLRSSMIYAVATHPDFQKKGLAELLIEYSNRYLMAEQVNLTLLVPAGEDLFRFYGKRGYRDGFYVREAVISREEIFRIARFNRTDDKIRQDANQIECRIFRTGPEEYNRRRKKMLAGHEFLDYRDDEIVFQKKLSLMYDADLLSIDAEGMEGCAYYERISQEEVIIKELLLPDEYLPAALEQIAAEIQCHRFHVRTPSWSGESLGGEVRAFGMLRNNVPDAPVKDESYLGFAYD